MVGGKRVPGRRPWTRCAKVGCRPFHHGRPAQRDTWHTRRLVDAWGLHLLGRGRSHGHCSAGRLCGRLCSHPHLLLKGLVRHSTTRTPRWSTLRRLTSDVRGARGLRRSFKSKNCLREARCTVDKQKQITLTHDSAVYLKSYAPLSVIRDEECPDELRSSVSAPNLNDPPAPPPPTRARFDN